MTSFSAQLLGLKLREGKKKKLLLFFCPTLKFQSLAAGYLSGFKVDPCFVFKHSPCDLRGGVQPTLATQGNILQ